MFFLLPRYSLIYSNQIFQLQKKFLTKCLHCLISNNVLAGSFFRKIRRNICRDMKADDHGIDSQSAHLEIQGQGNLGKRQLCHVLFSCRIFLWPLPISLPQSSSFLTEGCLLINGFQEQPAGASATSSISLMLELLKIGLHLGNSRVVSSRKPQASLSSTLEFCQLTASLTGKTFIAVIFLQ